MHFFLISQTNTFLRRTFAILLITIYSMVSVTLLETITIADEPGELNPDETARPVVTNKRSALIIKEAFAKTKTAKTIDQYEEIIQLCRQVMDGEASEARKAYIRQLKSWVHNRRGELLANEAARLAAEANDKKAQWADRQAFEDFETAITLDPTHWKAYHNRGVSHAMAMQYDKAIEDFNEAIELHPKYANTWFNRAEIHSEQGQFEAAISDYTQVIRLVSDDAGAYAGRAHANYRLGQYNQSLSDYSSAVRLDPANPEVYTNRAEAYSSFGYWKRAASDFRKAIELPNAQGRSYQTAAWMMATCPDANFRNSTLALKTAKKAIEINVESNYRYIDTLAAAYANTGNYEEAQATIERAIEIAPENAVDRLENRLALYIEKKPYRQVVRTASSSDTERR